jgi:hypothetical protein
MKNLSGIPFAIGLFNISEFSKQQRTHSMRYSSFLSVLAVFVVGISLAVSLRANYRNALLNAEQAHAPLTQTVGASSGQTSGRLDIGGNARVLLNGNPVRDGATVFAGGNLQTPANVRAGIALGQGNNVFMDEKSTATVNFTDRSIDLKLDDGAVDVATNGGTNGIIRDSNGTEIKQIPAGGVSSLPGNANSSTENSDKRKKAGGIAILGASSIPAWASIGTGAVYTTILTSTSLDVKGDSVDSRPDQASQSVP